jgi:hypothetical protein
MKKLFPTSKPFLTKTFLFIPENINLKIKLKNNDLPYLIFFYSLKNKRTTDREGAIKYLNICKKSKSTEYRRINRLKKLNLL